MLQCKTTFTSPPISPRNHRSVLLRKKGFGLPTQLSQASAFSESIFLFFRLPRFNLFPNSASPPQDNGVDNYVEDII